ncbi:hypothetical protein KY290_007663 [Solanum tuberosum]|uniref:Uncharacterized protein n=1 Tax=Solanum tuberosum TaxID=4113 RepID=A0ABQ7W8X5_SOLTU|nr:hypothetical protein KY290_007663 [Solanum tuberosum]
MVIVLDDFASLVLTNTKLDCAAEIANEVAHVAEQIIRKFCSSRVRFVFREKNGDGPVTCIDIEAEEAIVSLITNAFPSHSIYGEEINPSSRAVYLGLGSH